MMTKITHIPRLDGVRAVAISLVLIEHFSPWPRIHQLNLGALGVRLFFVLSGFLITRILLNHRDSGESIRDCAVRFYWRRLLRLSPVYYISIIFALILGLSDIDKTWLTDATYLANFRVVLQGHWDGSSHFWSLSVEEQFYIIWFLIVIACPKNWLLPAIWSAIIGAPLFRAAVFLSGGGYIATYVLLPGCMDALATGALIAVYHRSSFVRKLGAPWLLLIFLLCLGLTYLGRSNFAIILRPSVANLAFLSLISGCIQQKTRASLDWLTWKPLTHLGKISYGVYVYHYFVPEIYKKFIPNFTTNYHYVAQFSKLATIFMIVEISWWAIERPILRLKDHPVHLRWLSSPVFIEPNG